MADMATCRSSIRRRRTVAAGCARRLLSQTTSSDDPSDAELIARVREGDLSAYGWLYRRHRDAAYNLARQVTWSRADADDRVAEAFTRVLGILLGGGGPDSAFRAYLLTALRHSAYDQTRRNQKIELADDIADKAGDLLAVPFQDTVVEQADRTMAARAFAQLPARWQEAIRHTELDGLTPAAAAVHMGLTPNGMSALAYRARAGLRVAYLQMHLAASGVAEQCKPTFDRLGGWARGALNKRETTQVNAHLEDCKPCRARTTELREFSSQF